MIKKPEEYLKKSFANGMIPSEQDFADLIDSFIPRDAMSDDDLAAFRQLIAWWRRKQATDTTQGSAGVAAPSTSSETASKTDSLSTAVTEVTTALPVTSVTAIPSVGTDAAASASSASSVVVASPGLGAGSNVVMVPADGVWHPLTITSEHDGTWICSVSTLDPRPGYRVTGHAIASCVAEGKRLVQNMDRDSVLPWHTLQFEWRIPVGASASSKIFELAVRSRYSFGQDTKGGAAMIQCVIDPRASA